MGEEYQSWTGGTKIAEGDIKGGGTWELFTW